MKPAFRDAEGAGIKEKAKEYFGIHVSDIRTLHILTFDVNLTEAQFETIRTDIFTNPVTQVSAYTPLANDFHWCIWVGFRPGVRDTAGSTAIEAIADGLGIRLADSDAVYTSRRYCLQGADLTRTDAETIAKELLANDIIQQWRVYSREEWDPDQGIGLIIPRVKLDHVPTITPIPIASDAVLKSVSDARNLALNVNDIPVIRRYFSDPDVKANRRSMGLDAPTDVELEYLAQARSDHCNHNTFRGLFRYMDGETGETEHHDNLFKTCIQQPTQKLQAEKDWVISVLWDNAGVGAFDEETHYVITGETHNSPSNMEAYGGSMTGIVGVYRDPLGTGLGSRLIMGSYGYCVGPRDYDGALKPKLHPRRLLDGVIEGVRDGGNKSGIPTGFGQVMFHPSYLGKCLVFVTAIGLMPKTVKGKPGHEKKTTAGEYILMCGGRVGKDGIHGVTASSETFSANTPAGHVQIGDPYTQKKMHDFILEARDEGLIAFITDNGGGGLSSSIGESAEFSNGCEVALDKVPLKYEGLDQWEIWVSESQERMTLSVKPEHLDRFQALAEKHAIESTVIGRYTDTGKLHLTYNGETCAYIDMDLLSAGFPQWEFDAVWTSPASRGLLEPVIGMPTDWNRLITDMLAQPNICSKEWIVRQYDHEVQGTSIIKPLTGAGRDIPSDAAVIRPVLSKHHGLAFSQSLLPTYSAIDAYHMTACTIDEAVRRILAVGGTLDHIGGVDNYCWPSIQYHPETNPDGPFKAAQLVRSCKALKAAVEAWGIPLLSGKDSMYVDGHLTGAYGQTQKVSGLETLQFSAVGRIADISTCVTLDAKMPGDRVYVLGVTRDELGGSEYYALLGYVGAQVPTVDFKAFQVLYKTLTQVIAEGLVASVHGVYRGGLGVHLPMVAMGGRLGLEADISAIPVLDPDLRADRRLFSESAGRFIVTVAPEHWEVFEKHFKGLACRCIGTVTALPDLVIRDGETPLVSLPVETLVAAWKAPFGELI